MSEPQVGGVYEIDRGGQVVQATYKGNGQWEDLASEQPRDLSFGFTDKEIKNPFLQTLANIPGSGLRFAGDVIEGTAALATMPFRPSTYGAIAEAGQDFFDPQTGAAVNKFNQAASSAFNTIAEPYKPENIRRTITEDPIRPLMDILSLFPGVGLPKRGSEVARLAAKAGKTTAHPIEKLREVGRNWYTRGASQADDFNIPGMADIGTPPVNTNDLVSTYKRATGETPSIGFATGNRSALDIQGLNQQGSLDQLNKLTGGLRRIADDTMNLPGTAPISVNSSNSEIAANVRNVIVAHMNERASNIQALRNNVINDLVAAHTPAPGQKFRTPTGQFTKPPTPPAAAEVRKNPSKYLDSIDDPTIKAKIKAEQAIIAEMKAQRDKLLRLDPVRLATSSEDTLSPALGRKTVRARNIDPNRDYTDLTKDMLSSDEVFSKYLKNVPGMTPEVGGQVLLHNLFTSAESGGMFNAVKFAEGLHNNSRKIKLVTDQLPNGGAIKSGLLAFAKTLERQKETAEAIIRMAPVEGSRETAALINLGAGVGAGLKGRGVFGAAQYSNIWIQSKVLSQVLLHPDGVWLMNRIAGQKPGTLAAQSSGKQLLKLLGELNLPARVTVGNRTVELNGEEGVN